MPTPTEIEQARKHLGDGPGARAVLIDWLVFRIRQEPEQATA